MKRLVSRDVSAKSLRRLKLNAPESDKIVFISHSDGTYISHYSDILADRPSESLTLHLREIPDTGRRIRKLSATFDRGRGVELSLVSGVPSSLEERRHDVALIVGCTARRDTVSCEITALIEID